MKKLDYITTKDKLITACEHWSIDDDIKVRITKFNDFAVTRVSHVTGDIADQIYHKIKLFKYFSDLKLGGVSCYSIEVPLEKLDKFLQYLEKMDRSSLRKGKHY